MMRAIASYIMRGPMQAVLVTVISGVLSLVLFPFSHISGAAVGLVSLRHGVKQGAIVMVSAIVVTAAIAFASLGQPYFAVGIAAIVWIPAMLLALVLRYTVSLPKTLVASILVGWACIIITYAVLDDPAAWWYESVINPLFSPVMEQDNIDGEQRQVLQEYLENSAENMTGLLAAFMMYFQAFTLIIARWWQSMLYNPGGFRTEFCSLKLGKPLVIVLVVLGVIKLLSIGLLSSIAGHFAMVVFALFAVQGLSIAHSVASKLSASTIWLVAIYFLLFFFWQFVALAGLIDNWIALRDYPKKKTPD